jgi:hypothetical protein
MPLGTSLTYPFPYKTLDGNLQSGGASGGNFNGVNGVFSGFVTVGGNLTVGGTTTTTSLVVTDSATAENFVGIGSLNGKLSSSQQNTYSLAASNAEGGFQAISNNNTSYVDFNIINSTNAANPDTGIIRAFTANGLIITATGANPNIIISPGGTTAIEFEAGGNIYFPTQSVGQVLATNGVGVLTSIPYSAANTPSTLVKRDVNGNITGNNNISSLMTTIISANNTTITLTVASAGIQIIRESGAGNYTGCVLLLPNTTTLIAGQTFILNNQCTTTTTLVETSTGSAIIGSSAGSYLTFICLNTAVDIASSWDFHSQANEGTVWSNSTLTTTAQIIATGGFTGPVGANAQNTGEFTTLQLTTNMATAGVLLNSNTGAITSSLGPLGIAQGGTGNTTGTATTSPNLTGVVTSVGNVTSFNSGAINSATIGVTTPSTGNFTSIGATTAGTGIFTALSATSGINTTTVGIVTPAAGNFTTIGATTAGTGKFTTVTDTGLTTVGVTTNTAAGLLGTTNGAVGQALTSAGAGNLPVWSGGQGGAITRYMTTGSSVGTGAGVVKYDTTGTTSGQGALLTYTTASGVFTWTGVSTAIIYVNATVSLTGGASNLTAYIIPSTGILFTGSTVNAAGNSMVVGPVILAPSSTFTINAYNATTQTCATGNSANSSTFGAVIFPI